MSESLYAPALAAHPAPALAAEPSFASRGEPGVRATVRSLRVALSGPHPTDSAEAYAGAAEAYGLLHWVWLRLAGGRAERGLLRAVGELAADAEEVLDAGCGTGRLSRRIGPRVPGVRLTLLDASAAMLACARDVPGRHVVGDLLELPFPAERFGLVVVAWALETLPDPAGALRECARVLVPGGHIAYCYSTLPATPLRRVASAPLRRVVTTRFAGSFLEAEPEPPGECELVRRLCRPTGLAGAVVLRKRCAVAA